MTYELAKQLEEAGFPQKVTGSYVGKGSGLKREQVRIPTLTELVEACGKGFLSLVRKSHWEVYGCQQFEGGMQLFTEGSSPEEAVAKLWLELNKK